MSAPNAKPLLRVEDLHRLENDRPALNGISFTQNKGERLAIAGATGSGKSTLLKMIAGLIQPSAGEIYFNEELVKGPDEQLLPGHPAIAYLSQHFELRNHYRVEEVLAMASRVSATEAHKLYELCRIANFLKRWTHELSGGERQRVALAQLLVTSPQLLLMDEPWSNLDHSHKQLLKTVVEEVTQHIQITCILVSHDPADILPWADRILVLKEGSVVQDDHPQTIYYKPIDLYVADLFGRFNLLKPLLQKAFGLSTLNQDLFIRPNQFLISKKQGAIKASVSSISFLGSYSSILLDVLGEELLVYSLSHSWQVGEQVYVSLIP